MDPSVHREVLFVHQDVMVGYFGHQEGLSCQQEHIQGMVQPVEVNKGPI